MMGLSGVVAGRSSRPTDAVASTSPDAAPTGSPTTLRSARGSVPATRRARPRVRRHSWPSASTTRSACVSTRPAGSARKRTRRRLRLARVLDQRGGHPDQPDAVGERVVELQHQRGPAAGEAPDDVQLPQRPRAIESLHGDRLGEVEHRAHAAAGRARRASARGSLRSKCGSTSQRGGAIEYGFETTRWRRRGICRVARSILSSSRSRSGAASSHQTTVIVERSSGSFSMCHMSASLSLMRCSKRMASVTGGMLPDTREGSPVDSPAVSFGADRIDPGSIGTLSLRAVSERPPRLSTWTKVLYGLGAVAFGVKDNGFSFFLLLYYNQVLGLPESWVGLRHHAGARGSTRLRPLVGYLSDHLHSRWGRRHPFMYASAAAGGGRRTGSSGTRPSASRTSRCFAYFLVVSVLVRVFVAVNEIPSASLVPELTDQYDERTSILSYRFFFGWWGGLTMTVLAYAVFLQPDADASGGRAEPRRDTARYGLVASIIDVCGDPRLGDRHPRLHPVSQAAAGEATCRARAAPSGELMETLSNRSFLALFCGEHLRRHGGRTHRRARHLLQHLLLGADVEPDLGSRARLLRLGRARGGGRSGVCRGASARSAAAIATRSRRS